MFEQYDMDDLLTGRQAAAVARVRPQLICYWAEKGYLPVANPDSGKRPVYRRGDVLQAEAKMSKSYRSHRKQIQDIAA